MKNILPIALFLSIFLPKLFIKQLHVLPTIFGRSPDAVALLIAVIVFTRIISRRSFNIPAKYLVLFFFFTFSVFAGLAINQISIETLFSGFRTYYKFIPLFLLPLAYDYSESDIKKQLYVLFALGFLQIPVVLWQKFVTYKHLFTGDVITGTLSISNTLTIIMVGILLVFLSLYIRKLISLKLLILLSVIFMIPVSLNETKVTIGLLPLGIASVFLISWKELSKKQLYTIPVSGFIMILAFILAYDAFYKRDEYGFIDIMTTSDKNISNPGYAGTNVDPSIIFDTENNIVGFDKYLKVEEIPAARFDGIFIALNTFMTKDVVRLFFGFGIGNVNSSLGQGGHYRHLYYLGGTSTAMALAIWETGIIGAISFMLFVIFVAKDSILVSKEHNTWGVLAMAWFGYSVIIFFTLMYNNLFLFNEQLGLFIYLSGIIVFRKYATGRNQRPEQYFKNKRVVNYTSKVIDSNIPPPAGK